VVMHHIVSDGWSMGVIVRELAALYEARCAKRDSPLPELAIQYPDYAEWQRDWLSGERLERQQHYWKTQLQGPLAVLELPTDKPRPAVQTYSGATHLFRLSPELTRQLKSVSGKLGATLFMTMLAAFKALLHRYTGQTDLSVGTPIANRSRAELEGLIGFFVNTLVLRTELGATLTFAEAVAKEREAALSAYGHQDLPFEQLVEALQPERNLSRTPLFQVMFALQNAPMAELELPGLRLEPMELGQRTSKFELTLQAAEHDGGLACAFEYNTDLFEAAGQSGEGDWRFGATRRSRAQSLAGRVEPDSARLSAREDHRVAVRGAGGEDAGRDRGRV
jgi:condensation domain-containing protein